MECFVNMSFFLLFEMLLLIANATQKMHIKRSNVTPQCLENVETNQAKKS